MMTYVNINSLFKLRSKNYVVFFILRSTLTVKKTVVVVAGEAIIQAFRLFFLNIYLFFVNNDKAHPFWR